MDTSTREVATKEELTQKAIRRGMSTQNIGQSIVEIDPANLSEAQRRFLAEHGRATIGRNHVCPCGSHRRFKLCHGKKSKK